MLDVIEKEKLCDKALELGNMVSEWGAALQSETEVIGDVRVLGAMCAIEFVKRGDANEPDADLTKAVATEALKRGVLLLTCGVRGNVIRFLPPLTIEPAMFGEALGVVADVVRELG